MAGKQFHNKEDHSLLENEKFSRNKRIQAFNAEEMYEDGVFYETSNEQTSLPISPENVMEEVLQENQLPNQKFKAKSIKLGNNHYELNKEEEELIEEVINSTGSAQLPKEVNDLMFKQIKERVDRDMIQLPKDWDSIWNTLEPKLYYDDDKVTALCRYFQVRAFTYEYQSTSHIFFNKGEYAPEYWDGQHLIRHELIHVIENKSAELTFLEVIGKLSKIKNLVESKPLKPNEAIDGYNLLNSLTPDRRELFFNLFPTIANDIIWYLPAELMSTADFGFTKNMDNRAIILLLEENETWEELNRFELVISMIVQSVDRNKDDVLNIIKSKLPKYEGNGNESILTSYGYDLQSKSFVDSIPETGSENKGEISAGLKGLGEATYKRGVKHLGIFYDWLGWDIGKDRAKVENFSLGAFQKKYGGSIVGLKVNDEAVFDNFELDFGLKKRKKGKDYRDINEAPQNDKKKYTPETGYILATATNIPIESINVAMSDMTTRSGSGGITGLFLKFTWPSGGEGKSYMQLEADKFELNHLRIIFEDSNIGIGDLDVKGLKTSYSQEFKGESFDSISGVFYGLFDQLLGVSFVLIDSLQIVINKILPQIGTNAGTNLQEQLAMLLAENGQLDMIFDSVELKNIIMSDQGIIESFELGSTEINLKMIEKADSILQRRENETNPYSEEKDIASENIDALTRTYFRAYSEVVEWTSTAKFKEADASKNPDFLLKYQEMLDAEKALKDAKMDLIQLQQNQSDLFKNAELSLGISTEEPLQLSGANIFKVLYGEKATVFAADVIRLDKLKSDVTMSPEGIETMETEVSVPLMKLNGFRFSTESGITVGVREDYYEEDQGNVIVTNALVNTTLNFDKKSGQLVDLIINSFEIESLETDGFFMIETGELGTIKSYREEPEVIKGITKYFELPPGKQAVFKGISSGNLRFNFPLNKNGEIELTSTASDEEKGWLTINSSEIGKDKDGNIKAALGILVKGFRGAIGANIGSINFTIDEKGKKEIRIENPDFLLGESPYGSPFYKEILGEGSSDRKMLFSHLSLLSGGEGNPFLSASKVSLSIDPENEHDVFVKITNPVFKEITILDESTLIKSSWVENFITGDRRDHFKSWAKNTTITFSGSTVGDFYAYREQTDDETLWTLQLSKDDESKNSEESSLNISSGEFHIVKEGDSNKKVKKDSSKEPINFDLLNSTTASISINLKGTSIPLEIEEEGYIRLSSFASGMQKMHTYLVNKVDQTGLKENIHAIEETVIHLLSEKSYTFFSVKRGIAGYIEGYYKEEGKKWPEDFRNDVRSVYGALDNITYGTQVKDGMCKLIVYNRGRETTALDLAPSGNMNASKTKVLLSAVLDYQINTPGKKGVNLLEELGNIILEEVKSVVTTDSLKENIEKAKNYELPSTDEVKKTIKNEWDTVGFNKTTAEKIIFWKENVRDYSRMVIEATFLQTLKVMIEEDPQISFNGKILSDEVTSNIKGRWDLQEVMFELDDIHLPAFTESTDNKELSSSGIYIEQATIGTTSGVTMDDYTMKVNNGKMYNPVMKIRIPKENNEEND